MRTTTYDRPPERLYRVPLPGGWNWIDATSDGMCGRVVIEHPETTRLTSFHWSVRGSCDSQHAALEAARAWIEAGCPDEDEAKEAAHA